METIKKVLFCLSIAYVVESCPMTLAFGTSLGDTEENIKQYIDDTNFEEYREYIKEFKTYNRLEKNVCELQEHLKTFEKSACIFLAGGVSSYFCLGIRPSYTHALIFSGLFVYDASIRCLAANAEIGKLDLTKKIMEKIGKRNPAILNHIGESFKTGGPLGYEPETAAKCFQLAANEGYLPASCNLAKCYKDGIGVEEDLEYAMELFEQAGELGYEELQILRFQLGDEDSDASIDGYSM
ncbi:MAG: tetratricopeptide repeat protein [Oligoflexales bacterium]